MRCSTVSRSRPRSRRRLPAAGVIFCPFSEAVQKHPELIERYLGSVVPYTDNFYATLNSAVFTDGSFVYVPPGVRCPMELSTYFRINAANTGQFERTLIIADAGSYVSYLEGCTAPMRDENQLHAAVVELVALDDAQIKYSTVQNWYPGDEHGRGGIYNFVTKRGECRGRNSHISWTQVETGSAITWKYPSCILRGENSVGEFYSVATTNNYQQADTGTKMIHIGANTRSTIVSKGISAGHGQNAYRGLVKILPSATGARNFTQCDSLLMGTNCGAHTFPYIEVRNPTATVEHEASTSRISEEQLFYCLQRGIEHRGCGQHDRQRLLPHGVQGVADGICGRSPESARRQPRRSRRMNELRIRPLPRSSRRSAAAPLLEIRDLHASGRRAGQCCEGVSLARARRRSARHHGTERLGQEHAGARAGRPARLRDRLRQRELRGPRPAGAGARAARARGAVPGLPVPGGDSRVSTMPTCSRPRSMPRGANAARAELDAFEFLALVRAKIKLMQIDESFLSRGVNEGFSGGEKKRNEILQMLVLEPKLALLDETDSGLDIDALKVVANGVNSLRAAGARHRAGHALPAPARLRRARLRACARARPDRAQRRSQPGARARAARLRLDQRTGGSLTAPMAIAAARSQCWPNTGMSRATMSLRRATADTPGRAARARAEQLRELGWPSATR